MIVFSIEREVVNVKKSFIGLVLCITISGFLAGCESDEGSSVSGTVASASGADTETCVVLEALEVSLDRLEESDSFSEYRERYAQVREQFEKLRVSSDSRYAAETKAFESALDEFEASLNSLGDNGLVSGLLQLAGDTAELAAAGDTLDDAIDC